MGMFAVKNDKGEWLNVYADSAHWSSEAVKLAVRREQAESRASRFGGHVVELVEAPAKIVVSEQEAEMLKKAKNKTVWLPASVISAYAYDNMKDSDSEALLEDRLMRAYVNGWTADKPKRYVLPMPGTEYHNIQMHGNAQYYAIKGTGNWRPDAIALGTDDAVEHGYTVTQADIDAAPDWVRALKPVEVTDDDIS